MHIDFLSLVPVLSRAVVLPNDLFLEGDLLQLGPRIMKQDVPVGKQLHVVMSRVPLRRSFRIVLPEHLPFTVSDGEHVLAVGCSDEDESIVEGFHRESQEQENGME